MKDRPLECCHCKRPISTIYKEIGLNGSAETHMCSECPVLQTKLHGNTSQETKIDENKPGGICCSNCGTSIETIRTTAPLGCNDCYNVFEELITRELKAADKIAAGTKPSLEGASLHLGKSPHQPTEVTLSKRLKELNEELNDALKRENYEQAAWLRDQIKEIMEKSNG